MSPHALDSEGSKADLPQEILDSILCRLRFEDLKTCKLVCRTFYRIIKHDPGIAWILELGEAGYTEPSWPRSDISLKEKSTLFRTYIKHTRSWVFTGFDDVLPAREWVIPTAAWNIRTRVFEGVFAQWSTLSTDPPGYYNQQADMYVPEWHYEPNEPAPPYRLDLIQVPSNNRGTGWKHWTTIEPKLQIKDFGISPSRNLLVIVEQRERNEAGLLIPHSEFTIHLRTLSTNEPHPSAFGPEIFIQFPGDSNYLDFGFKFIGDLLAISVVGVENKVHFRLLIWDWKSDNLVVDHSSDFTGHSSSASYAFLSERLIAIPRLDDSPIHLPNSVAECVLVWIDVFSMDASDNIEGPQPLKLLASLELPSTLYPYRYSPTPGSGQQPVAIQTFASPLSAETSGCQKHSCDCGWHNTFELMDEHHTLCIHFNEWTGDPDGASFYIPFRTLLDCVSSQRMSIASPRGRVPWDEWAHDVSWMANGTINRMDISDAHRAQSRRKGRGEKWPNGSFRIYVQDFNPRTVKWALKGADRGLLGPNTCVRWPDLGRTKAGALIQSVPLGANHPFVETYIDFDGLSERMRGLMMSPIIMFEDLVIVLKHPEFGDWTLQVGILLLTK
ncbi:hypothetical protein BDV93DRAFT_548882 [Ceratobasidium sp. AG-I]|nr:hypothetical protein BDV93DRAFT_548882 [Ceratobasidium sp. AG-I]